MKRLIYLLILFLFIHQGFYAQQVINGLSFDGINDYVDLGNSENLKPTNEFFFEAWVNANNWNQSGIQYIISCAQTAGYYLRLNNGTLEAAIFRNGEYANVLFDVSAFSGWQHVALNYDGENFYLYVNGILRDYNESGANYEIEYDDSNVVLGANFNASEGFFNGILDEIRFWSVTRAITSGSINLEISPLSSGLISYYRCNQGIAGGDNTGISFLTDYSSNALNGTLNNFALTGSSSNFVNGKALRSSRQSHSIEITNYQTNQLTFSWSRPGVGNGGNGVKVFMRANASTGSASPSDGIDYTANSSFGSGQQIGTSGWYCVYDGSATNITVTNLSPGTQYRIHVIEYQRVTGQAIRYTNASVTNNPRSTYTLFNSPTTQASNLVFTGITASSFNVSWSRGNGSNCIVFVKNTSNNETPTPVDRTTYTANSNFGSGSQIGSSGWYCVYKGTATNVTVNNLLAGNNYRVMVIEFNGVVGFEAYLSTSANNNPKNQQTDYQTPTIQSSNISLDNKTSSTISVSWNNGNGTARALFVKATDVGTASPVNNTTYTANAAFGLGSQIGTTGWYCVYNGYGSNVTVTNLNAGTTYRFMLCEYNGIPGLEKYNTSSVTNNPINFATDGNIPTVQASNIIVTDLSTTAASIYVNRGNGQAVAIFMAQTNTGSALPVNNTTYQANTLFGSGDQIGSTGWYCVYNGTENYVYVTGLQVGTTYRVMACEYNGTVNNEQYNTNIATDNPINFETAYDAPQLQATNIQFSGITNTSATISWTRGDGQRCAAFIYQGSSGSAAPVDDITYTANSIYSYGSQIGASGWYCIYNGTSNNVNVTGLASNKNYRVMVVEYNGTLGYEKYNIATATGNPNNFTTTSSGPTVQTSNINFPNVWADSLSITWTRGNGSSCVVFAKQGSSGTALPVDGTTYNADATFMNGSQIGTTGWYCIYKGTGNQTKLKGLTPNTSYIIMVCEFNGTVGNELYNTNTSSNNPRSIFTDFKEPTTQASNLVFSNTTTSSFTINWTNGNGTSRVVFVKATSNNETATPNNNTTYYANSIFGNGTQIDLTGWYCVFNGTGSSVTVTGLSANTTYRAMVIEYNGSSGKQKYNIYANTNNPLNNTTAAPSGTTQARNLVFSSITNNSFTISWIRGNGLACAVFIKNTGSGTAIPDNNTTYVANTQFGLGSQIGNSGWYCIYNGTGNSVTVTGLSSANIYRVMVCEYTGNAGNEQYNLSTANNNPFNQLTNPFTIWNGTTWSNGAPNANTAARFSANYSESSNLICKTLLIDNNINVLIQPGNQLTVHERLVNYGTLRLVSPLNLNPSGSLITYGTIENNRTMTAERYITPGTLAADNYVWHFMGNPVTAFTVEKSFVGDYVHRHNESTNTWISLRTGDFILPTIGYMVKTIKAGGKTIIFNGTFNTGSFSIPLVNTGNTENNGYNLVSNPYPSAIDWNATAGWTKTNISNTIWIWNPVTSNYATWNGFVGVNGGSRYIPSMQGFFVKVNLGQPNGTLAMNDNVRVHSTQPFLRKQSKENYPIIRLLAFSSENYSDELAIVKANEEWRSEKFFSMNEYVPQIFVRDQQQDYAIYTVDNFDEFTEIQLGYKIPAENSTYLKLAECNIDTSILKIRFVDITTKQIFTPYQLSNQKFEGQEESIRWLKLLFVVGDQSTTSTYIAEKQNIKIWSNNKILFVHLYFDTNVTLEIYNLLGVKVKQNHIAGNGLHRFELDNDGVYFVRVLKGLDVIAVRKVFVKN